MLEIGMVKDSRDALEKEILRERATVLGRAGESVSDALEKLSNIEQVIDEQMVYLNRFVKECAEKQDYNHECIRRQIVEINGQISKYNSLKEYARLRYHYLIVTREAMGMRKHTWAEKVYMIPPKKRYLVTV